MVLMVHSNIMLCTAIFVLSWIVFFGISRLVRMPMTVRLVSVALLSLAAASHQLLVYYGGLYVLAVPHFVFYCTTFATNLLFFSVPIAALVYLSGFIRWISRHSKRRFQSHYRTKVKWRRTSRLGRAYSKLRYQLARSKVKERWQRRKAFAQAKVARQAANILEQIATNQNSLEKSRQIKDENEMLRTAGTITWSSGDEDKITYSDGTGTCTVIDTRIYDQHGYRSDGTARTYAPVSASEGARALANSLFGGEGDFVAQSIDFDPKTLPGNVQIISGEDDSDIDFNTRSQVSTTPAPYAQRNNAAPNTSQSHDVLEPQGMLESQGMLDTHGSLDPNSPQDIAQAAAAVRATSERLDQRLGQGKLAAKWAQLRARWHKEQAPSYYAQIAQRAIEFGAQDEKVLSQDRRFSGHHPSNQRHWGLLGRLPWRTIGQYVAITCLMTLNVVAAFSTVKALTMPQVKYVSVTLDVPVEFEGLQIVQLSDLNIGGLYPRSRTTNIVSKVMSMHPDLIVLTGSIAHGDPKLVERRMHPLFSLKASMGVFVLIGDEFNSNLYNQLLHRYNDTDHAQVHFLTNDSTEINVGRARMCITGIADSKSQLAQFLNYATSPTFNLAYHQDESAGLYPYFDATPTEGTAYLQNYEQQLSRIPHTLPSMLASTKLHAPSMVPLHASSMDVPQHLAQDMALSLADQIAQRFTQKVAQHLTPIAVSPTAPARSANAETNRGPVLSVANAHNSSPSSSLARNQSNDRPATYPNDTAPLYTTDGDGYRALQIAPANSSPELHANTSKTASPAAATRVIEPNRGYLPHSDNTVATNEVLAAALMPAANQAARSVPQHNAMCDQNRMAMGAPEAPGQMNTGICEDCLNAPPELQGPCARRTEDMMTKVTAIAANNYNHYSNHASSAAPELVPPSNADHLNAAYSQVESNQFYDSFNAQLYSDAPYSQDMAPTIIHEPNCPCWHDMHWEESTSHQRLIHALTNQSIKQADFNLLLSDSPAYTMALSRISDDSFDLMLTGSTYGGMAPVLSNLVSDFNGGFLSGLYSISQRMQLYVSSGTNSWAPAPIRLGNSGEITLITVHSRHFDQNLSPQRRNYLEY